MHFPLTIPIDHKEVGTSAQENLSSIDDSPSNNISLCTLENIVTTSGKHLNMKTILSYYYC